jgi:hypothetical protein
MNNRLVKRILSNLPEGYAYADNVFYLRDAKHVVVGFGFDSSPSYITAYRYVMPLFIPFDGTHLGYSDCIASQSKRLGQGNAEFEGFYLSSIDPYRGQVRELDDLDRFTVYIEAKIESKLDSGYCDELKVADLRYCYACALVLLNDCEKAAHQLDLIIAAYDNYVSSLRGSENGDATSKVGRATVTKFHLNSLPPHSSAFLKTVGALRETLDRGDDGARKLILQVQEVNRNSLLSS